MSDLFDVIRKYGMRLYGWKDSGFCCTVLLGEITDILNAIDRLSPSTRRLLIERPEAVEACVDATKKQKASVFAFIRGDESAENFAAEYYVAINNAIALLPEETT